MVDMEDALEAARASGPLVAGALFGALALALQPRWRCTVSLLLHAPLRPRARLGVVHLGGRRALLCTDGARVHCTRVVISALLTRLPPLRAQTPALWYLPGVTATLALLMINAVRRDELAGGYDADGMEGRKRAWMLLSYLVSFASLGWAVAGLLVYFTRDGHDAYTGCAAILQCVLIVAAALIYWTTRGGSGSASYY
jgi:hypothetical protein